MHVHYKNAHVYGQKRQWRGSSIAREVRGSLIVRTSEVARGGKCLDFFIFEDENSGGIVVIGERKRL